MILPSKALEPAMFGSFKRSVRLNTTYGMPSPAALHPPLAVARGVFDGSSGLVKMAGSPMMFTSRIPLPGTYIASTRSRAPFRRVGQ